MAKYLKEDEINLLIGEIILHPEFSIMSQDSYNETLIGKAINKTGKQKDLLQATLNVAIVGVGNKRYGSYRIGEEVIDIAQSLTSLGVKLRLPQGAILKEDDLTVGRLCRFFRYKIREFLRNTKTQTYLFRKYSNHDAHFAEICFRGSEYLDDLDIEQMGFLQNTYITMDQRLQTNFTERFDRIQQAKTGLTYKLGI